MTPLFLRGLVASAISLLVATVGCSADKQREWPAIKQEIRERFPAVSQMSSDELFAALDEPSPPILLDARSSEEFGVSHLRSALSAPSLSAAREVLAETSTDQPIVIYCSVGYRSSQMAGQLGEAGYTDVHNYEGSIFEWANRGWPVYRDGDRVDEVHPFDDDWGMLLDRDRWSEKR